MFYFPRNCIFDRLLFDQFSFLWCNDVMYYSHDHIEFVFVLKQYIIYLPEMKLNLIYWSIFVAHRRAISSSTSLNVPYLACHALSDLKNDVHAWLPMLHSLLMKQPNTPRNQALNQWQCATGWIITCVFSKKWANQINQEKTLKSRHNIWTRF